MSNQRNYFRIEDTVGLQLLPITAEDAGKPADAFFSHSSSFLLWKQLHHLDRDLQNMLRTLATSDREAAGCLRLLNKKVDLIGQAVVNQAIDQTDTVQLDISLSEGGLAYRCAQPPAMEQMLAIKLVLLNDNSGLFVTGRVVEITAEDNGDSRVSVAFINLDESDRQLLARHILQTQSQQLKQRQQ